LCVRTLRDRNKMKKTIIAVLLIALAAAACRQTMMARRIDVAEKSEYLSPCAVVASPDGARLYIAEQTAMQIAVFDTVAEKNAGTVVLSAQPSGLALSADGSRLYATCGSPSGFVAVIDTATLAVVTEIDAGHTAVSPVLSPDGATLYVCNRYNNNVSAIGLASGKELRRIPVRREPIAAAITPDGRYLFVANHLPTGPSSVDFVAAVVSVIDIAQQKVTAEIDLPNGSTSLRSICVSPDGKYAYVPHILARFHMPTTQLVRGWMNTAGLSIIDVAAMKRFNTVLLDDVDKGSANPWAVACTTDSKTVCVTQAGTHEISVIDAPSLLEKLAKMPEKLDNTKTVDYTAASLIADDVPNDLSFLVGHRKRIKVKGNGPRALAIVGRRAYVPEYFTDSMSVVELDIEGYKQVRAVALGPAQPLTTVRTGEMFFNDAALCFQSWQSCESCHPDSRADGLNWDLLNDGMGNPKNSKSMLLAHRTPPSMSSGIRDSAEMAVRAGIKFIQFAVRPEEDAVAIDEYLKSMKPLPGPVACDAKLAASVERGRKLFNDPKVGCAACHSGELYTDLQSYDVGTRGELDRRDDFDTPTLIEVWRSAPYLHDGRSVEMKDVITRDNPQDKHGKTSQLSEEEKADLANFVLSL